MAIETTTVQANGLTFTTDLGTEGSIQEGSEGKDELVLFLHGFPHNRYTWRTELLELDRLGYQVAAFDQRGYSPGARPEGAEAYHIDNLVTDALAVAETFSAGENKFHLVGHDWGGQLGWIIAARYPERIRSLSVISRPHPTAFARALETDPEQLERSKHHRSFQLPEATAECLADDAAWLRAMLERLGAGPVDIEAYLEPLGSHEALDAAINWYRASGGATLRLSDLPPVTVPTLYVWGDADSSVGRIAAEGTADFVKGAYRFVEVSGGSHCITDQTPGLFAGHLLEHLRSL